MTEFSVRPEATQDAVVLALGDKVKHISIALGDSSSMNYPTVGFATVVEDKPTLGVHAYVNPETEAAPI